MPLIEQTGYGYLVSLEQGAWRFSFVQKEGSNAYQIGCWAGPYSPEPARRWRAERQAKNAMLSAGHTIVLQ
jgi:hypothetical protein